MIISKLVEGLKHQANRTVTRVPQNLSLQSVTQHYIHFSNSLAIHVEKIKVIGTTLYEGGLEMAS